MSQISPAYAPESLSILTTRERRKDEGRRRSRWGDSKCGFGGLSALYFSVDLFFDFLDDSLLLLKKVCYTNDEFCHSFQVFECT